MAQHFKRTTVWYTHIHSETERGWRWKHNEDMWLKERIIADPWTLSRQALGHANTLGFVSMNTVMNSTYKGLHENCFVVSISSAHTVFLSSLETEGIMHPEIHHRVIPSIWLSFIRGTQNRNAKERTGCSFTVHIKGERTDMALACAPYSKLSEAMESWHWPHWCSDFNVKPDL